MSRRKNIFYQTQENKARRSRQEENSPYRISDLASTPNTSMAMVIENLCDSKLCFARRAYEKGIVGQVSL